MAPCTKLTGAARLVQVLKVDGYSASTAMCDATSTRATDDGHIKSRWNDVGGYDWEVRLYPATLLFGALNRNENSSVWSWKNNSRWVGLKLVLLSEPGRAGNVKAALGCRLVDPRGTLEPAQEKSVSFIFTHARHCSPPLKLMERGDLEASGYLRGDCLALQCTVTVLQELPQATIIPAAKQVMIAPSSPSNLHEHLGELLRSGTGADVAFLVAGESFAAHKNILAARSPVFMAEFFGEMEEKRSWRVEVRDMEAAAFRAMLHFIYTDTVPEVDQEEEEATTTMAQHLLAAADRYGLDRLKVMCECRLSRGITVDTAATTLALAEQHGCEHLKARCVEFIISTPAILDAVAATEGYKHLEASCPRVLTELLKSARWGNN